MRLRISLSFLLKTVIKYLVRKNISFLTLISVSGFLVHDSIFIKTTGFVSTALLMLRFLKLLLSCSVISRRWKMSIITTFLLIFWYIFLQWKRIVICTICVRILLKIFIQQFVSTFLNLVKMEFSINIISNEHFIPLNRHFRFLHKDFRILVKSLVAQVAAEMEVDEMVTLKIVLHNSTNFEN